MSAKDGRNEKRRLMTFRESPSPPARDLEATVRWLQDREVIKNLYRGYAYGVDSIDFDLVRTVFHPDCVCVGPAESGQLDAYLDGMEEALHAWDASMHFVGNQYVEIDGDEGCVGSLVVGYHIEADDSPLEHLVLGLRYQDDLVRDGEDWKIIRRETAKQWHTGHFPRPFVGPPPYPRGGLES
ncbi:MAG: nuclear transport factor 2 family protein [bacterium]|nr:nuclear transport factor 2 family protein [bacterium]